MSNIFIEHLNKNSEQLKRIKLYFKTCAKDIDNGNIYMLRRCCMYISIVYIFMFTLALAILPAFKISFAYYLMPPLLIVYFFINLYTRSHTNLSTLATKIICLTFYFCIFFIFIMMDVVSFPKQTALWFPLMLVAFPILFIDRIYIISFEETIAVVIFCFFAYLYEASDIFITDLYNVIAAYVLSLLLDRILIDMRCNEGLAMNKLAELSSYDNLTHVLNKGALINEINIWCEHNSQDISCALCVIDVDDFKKVNDNLGHNTGDLLLEHIGKLMLENSESSDILGRFGGDEFIIFMPNIKNLELLKQKCHKIQMLLADFFIGNSMPFTLSIGAVLSNEYYNMNELFRIADDALYKSKISGKNMCTAWMIPPKQQFSKPLILQLALPEFKNNGLLSEQESDRFDIICALSVDEILAYLSQCYDIVRLILFDFNEKNASDTLFVRYIKSREHFIRIPIIAVAYDENSAHIAKAFGVDAILQKNSPPSEFAAAISKLVSV